MKNLVNITKLVAIDMFENYKKELSASGVALSNITYLVDESRSKTVGGKKLLQKMVVTNATIGSDYGKKVNKVKKKEGSEGEFVPREMNGKEFVGDCPVAKDTKTGKKRYLVFDVEAHTIPQTTLLLDGREVKRADVWNSDYITPKGLKPSEKVEVGRGEIKNKENEFFRRTLNFDNLIAFNMNGNMYLIVG